MTTPGRHPRAVGVGQPGRCDQHRHRGHPGRHRGHRQAVRLRRRRRSLPARTWSPTASSAAAFGALGHRVFRRLGTSGIPTFAFVNGAALGGGVELALHCDYRTLASNAAHGRTARGLPRDPARLGRHPVAPAHRRSGERRHGDHRERAQPEPDDEAEGRPAAGRGRRRPGRRRLPRAVAGLAGRSAGRLDHRVPHRLRRRDRRGVGSRRWSGARSSRTCAPTARRRPRTGRWR